MTQQRTLAKYYRLQEERYRREKKRKYIFFPSQRIHFLLHYFFLSHVPYQFYFMIPLQKKPQKTHKPSIMLLRNAECHYDNFITIYYIQCF